MPKHTKKPVPLLCNLCPKNPRFSDVSHLLTHISSKSHLSNRFKLQIRSQGEPEAKKLLADFDDWYAENRLEDLLSERLVAKEHKKTAARRTRLPSGPVPVKYENRGEKFVDPQDAVTPKFRPMVPHMHTWSTNAFGPSFAPHSNAAWVPNMGYETPTMKRNLPNFFCKTIFMSFKSNPDVSCRTLQTLLILTSILLDSPTPRRQDRSFDEIERECSKLKGIYWPGMNLFDSATTEMKRMRNQKKDGSALEQMKLSSAVVEPTELVFNADGGFRRARDIFDESPEGSPVNDSKTELLAEESQSVHYTSEKIPPSPKKRRTRKAMLTEMSTNTIRPRPSISNQPGRKGGSKRKQEVVDADMLKLSMAQHPSNLDLLSGFQYLPNAEENEEFRLTMGNLGKRQRVGIFRDAQEDSPGRTESPLEDHRFEYSIGRLNNHGLPGGMSQKSPTPIFRPIPIRFGGKENVDPGENNQRPLTNSMPLFHPGMFRGDSINPLYCQSSDHGFGYGNVSDFQDGVKSQGSTFNGDFRPVSMVSSFREMSDVQGFVANSGNGMVDNMPFDQ